MAAKDRLSRLAALLAEATPGPWTSSGRGWQPYAENRSDRDTYYARTAADAEMIALARSVLPPLLRLGALAERAVLVGAIEHLRGCDPIDEEQGCMPDCPRQAISAALAAARGGGS